MPQEELAALRDLLLSEIRRLDQVIQEREKQVKLTGESFQHLVEKMESESLRARAAANEWRGAMVDRESRFVLKESHDYLHKEVEKIRSASDQSLGRRAAWVGAAGIIATLLALGIGQVLRSNLTAADVSRQIQNEAPWNADKAEIERRISILERQEENTSLQISKLQQQLLPSTRGR